MRVIVTGGAGFIGSHIVDLLIERGHTVLIVDNLSSGCRDNINWNAKVVFDDITAKSFAATVEAFEPDAICHQAGQPSLRHSIDDPEQDARVNILGTLAVIQAAREAGAYVVMASTSAVYDVEAKIPYKEDSPIRPTLPYGISKAAAEAYLINSGMSAAVLRYGNVYGPRQIPVGENQLIPHCLGHLLHGKRFSIYGNGKRTRDFVYVGDVAQANVSAIESRVNGVYNISSGSSVSVNWVCGRLAALSGKAGYEFTHTDAKAGEAEHTRLANEAASFFWTPQTSLDDGLRMTVELERMKSNGVADKT